ncbi:hypothetical protein QR680_002126 [Steinernema hermaphroditum]|uniref:WxxW domain-containing protein n=1 Tax=Steinernema hermaphroditum TaxID=289476 RepID=A0AA39H1D2_9BILA|nr:hypothetical protein QR680_002126 [Steinernema hermaphroditum]
MIPVVICLLGLQLALQAGSVDASMLISSPFDNFRIECPQSSGAQRVSVRMVGSQGFRRQDIVFGLSCRAINELYPWWGIPQGIAELEREDCRYSRMFDPIVDTSGNYSCNSREYLAGISRISDTRVQLECCRMRTRDETNCIEKIFGKPFGNDPRTEIEYQGKLINAIRTENHSFKVRFCDLAPRAVGLIFEDVPPTTTTRSTTPRPTPAVTTPSLQEIVPEDVEPLLSDRSNSAAEGLLDSDTGATPARRVIKVSRPSSLVASDSGSGIWSTAQPTTITQIEVTSSSTTSEQPDEIAERKEEEPTLPKDSLPQDNSLTEAQKIAQKIIARVKSGEGIEGEKMAAQLVKEIESQNDPKTADELFKQSIATLNEYVDDKDLDGEPAVDVIDADSTVDLPKRLFTTTTTRPTRSNNSKLITNAPKHSRLLDGHIFALEFLAQLTSTTVAPSMAAMTKAVFSLEHAAADSSPNENANKAPIIILQTELSSPPQTKSAESDNEAQRATSTITPQAAIPPSDATPVESEQDLKEAFEQSPTEDDAKMIIMEGNEALMDESSTAIQDPNSKPHFAESTTMKGIVASSEQPKETTQHTRYVTPSFDGVRSFFRPLALSMNFLPQEFMRLSLADYKARIRALYLASTVKSTKRTTTRSPHRAHPELTDVDDNDVFLPQNLQTSQLHIQESPQFVLLKPLEQRRAPQKSTTDSKDPNKHSVDELLEEAPFDQFPTAPQRKETVIPRKFPSRPLRTVKTTTPRTYTTRQYHPRNSDKSPYVDEETSNSPFDYENLDRVRVTPSPRRPLPRQEEDEEEPTRRPSRPKAPVAVPQFAILSPFDVDFSRDIRRAPQKYRSAQNAASSQSLTQDMIFPSFDDENGIDSTKEYMEVDLPRLLKDGTKNHLPADGQPMKMPGLIVYDTLNPKNVPTFNKKKTHPPSIPPRSYTTGPPAAPSPPGVSMETLVSIRHIKPSTTLPTPKSTLTTSTSTTTSAPSTAVTEETTQTEYENGIGESEQQDAHVEYDLSAESTPPTYDPSKFYHTLPPKRQKHKENILTFCTKEVAIRDSNNLVIACGGEHDVWQPPRCPVGTDCFYATDSTYRICCAVSSG